MIFSSKTKLYPASLPDFSLLLLYFCTSVVPLDQAQIGAGLINRYGCHNVWANSKGSVREIVLIKCENCQFAKELLCVQHG